MPAGAPRAARAIETPPRRRPTARPKRAARATARRRRWASRDQEEEEVDAEEGPSQPWAQVGGRGRIVAEGAFEMAGVGGVGGEVDDGNEVGGVAVVCTSVSSLYEVAPVLGATWNRPRRFRVDTQEGAAALEGV
jgi:hypothetical protein